MTGLVRIRVVPESGAPVDLAVPGKVPVADLMPDLARLMRLTVASRLVTTTGRELQASAGLSEQHVADGTVLGLVPAEPGPLPVDDPAEALAAQIAADVLGWHVRLLRPVALAVVVLLLALAGAALARGPAWSGAVAASAVAALTGVASIAVHRRHERRLAAGCGWAAVGFAAVAGAQYAGSVTACVAAAATAAVLARALRGVGALLVPAVAAAVLLGCLALLATGTGLAPGLVAALGLVATALVVPALPRLALVVAQRRAGAARELLRAMLGATAVVMVVLAAPAAASGGAGAVLAAVIGLLAACRGSRHHGAVEVLAGICTGLVIAFVSAVVTILRHAEWSGAVGLGSLLVAGAAGAVALTAGGRTVESEPGAGPVGAGGVGGGARDPRLALAIDRVETLALVALVPLLVGVGGVVPLVSALVHR
jgi:hypothetical protein